MNPALRTLPASIPKCADPRTDSAIAFLIRLGTALHSYGTPSHRLETALSCMAEKLGLMGSFFALPTGLFVAFGAPEEQRTALIRVQPGDINLEKMTQLDELTNRVIDGDVTPEEGIEEVEAIESAPARYGNLVKCLCYGLLSTMAGRFLGGGWKEIVVSACIGVIIGLVALACKASENRALVFEPAAAALAAALAIVAAHLFRPLSVYVTTLAGLVVLLPGLMLTIAMMELATKNLLSGTARLTWAGLIFLEIAFGVVLGGQIHRLFDTSLTMTTPRMLPGWTEFAALMIAPIALSVVFNARPREIGWITAGCVTSYAGARIGATFFGWEFGSFFGAVGARVMGNLFARITGRPSAVVLMPGIMLLVPGSVGFTGVSKFLEQDVVTGVGVIFKMVLIATSLVTGLFMANLLVPQKKIL